MLAHHLHWKYSKLYTDPVEDLVEYSGMAELVFYLSNERFETNKSNRIHSL